MAWENRGNGQYYYLSRKLAGRVVKDYIGGGLAGLLAALEDAARRKAREAARNALRADQAAFELAATTHDDLSRAADALMTAALEDAGYHRHDRGAWRKRRAPNICN